MIKKNSLWINNKNGREYQVVSEAIDCTNERDGLIVVVYTCKEAEGKRQRADPSAYPQHHRYRRHGQPDGCTGRR